MKKTKKSRGLGDDLEKLFEKTGIAKAVKWIAGEDCGCERRRDLLNKAFSYKRTPDCFTKDEFIWLHDYFSEHRAHVTRDEQNRMLAIYNRIFKAKKEPSSCSSCVKQLYNELKLVYDSYQETE